MDKPENHYIPRFMPIEKVTKETNDTSLFRLKFDKDYQPGQFVQASVLGIGECPISIGSYEKNHMDLCIRNVGNVTDAILKLKPGDKLGIRGPYGKGYPMKDFFGRNIIVIGGGTGVAPLRGVIDFIEENEEKYGEVSIFFGFRGPEEILFKQDIDKWKKLFNLSITVDKADKKWKGNIGVITTLLEKAKLNKDNSVVITCGPPIMIKFVIQQLTSQGFDERQIWVSLERHMKCGIGKCGRCMINGRLVCEDGPVFNYLDAKAFVD